MNLTDKEILELSELCSALVDEQLTEQQKARLSYLLATSDAARRFYVRATGLSASLYSYASEMQTEGRDAPLQSNIARAWWAFGFLAAAATIVLLLWINQPVSNPVITAAQSRAREFVAQLTGAKECQWVNPSSSVPPGAQLQKGQRIELARGYAEITFDCGAQLVLEGPVSLDLNSA
jgi:ferric-dicitrate binding protein FerR (iron transport regulator)